LPPLEAVDVDLADVIVSTRAPDAWRKKNSVEAEL
jgi:hypothetical protein